MAAGRSSLLVTAIAVGMLAGGCGSGEGAGAKSATSSTAVPKPGAIGGSGGSRGSGPPTLPNPAPTGVPADPAAVAVIRNWSDALRRGDVRGAARYFSSPSEMINGPDSGGVIPVLRIRNLAEAEAANATLPCGAKLISTDRRGRYVNARFVLTDRPGLGGGCGSGTGLSARTNFVIAGGRIVEWIRAPDDPKDSQSGPPPTAPNAPAPANPQGGSPSV
jgi:hypothetical protein